MPAGMMLPAAVPVARASSPEPSAMSGAFQAAILSRLGQKPSAEGAPATVEAKPAAAPQRQQARGAPNGPGTARVPPYGRAGAAQTARGPAGHSRYIPPTQRPEQTPRQEQAPPAVQPDTVAKPTEGAPVLPTPADATRAVVERANRNAADTYGARIDALANSIAQLVTLLGSERELVRDEKGGILGSRIKAKTV